MKIQFLTLGCSKNTVDSEVLMGNLKQFGYQMLIDEKEYPETLVINTCGFIGDAKEQAIDAIISGIEFKLEGKIKYLIVMGCLVERYRDELMHEMPEVDAWFGVHEMPQLIRYFEKNAKELLPDRIITTPKHYAYLKIAEGCDRICAFCAIPLIRGRHISRTIEDILKESEILVRNGAKELILISQDLTYYGIDIYKKQALAQLIRELSKINNLKWIRLHYLYPHSFSDELMEEIAANPKVCKYIDIPLQHISDDMLRAMKRSTTKADTIALMAKFKAKIPEAAIRTTFIVGFPGETKLHFAELLDFVKDINFDRLGAFKYSEEEGTAAADLKDDINPNVKSERLEQLMLLQQQISLVKNKNKIGHQLEVVIDAADNENYYGRTEFDSPDVDGVVIIEKKSNAELEIGNFYKVQIIDAGEYDLKAVTV